VHPEKGPIVDVLDHIGRAVDQTGHIVAGVKPDQFGEPSPCEDWNVRELLNHTLGGMRMFAAAARGETVDESVYSSDLVGDDPAASFEREAAALKEAWSDPALLERTCELPFGAVPGVMAANLGFVEMLVHGWDIAKATGQQPQMDPELSEAALALMSQMPADQMRQPGVFGPEVTCPEGASIHHRLVAFLGRQP
jgi:uncharacterized protein (TIGR03086 family)